jgi:membrane-bound metal-dependent hydrolase YbcI (DUF457 family)
MASPVGHAMVGLAAAAVVARATGAPHTPVLWAGSVIAAGLPDLDLALPLLGLKGAHFHRHASHSLLVIAGLLVAAGITLAARPMLVDWRIAVAWSLALVSHPLVDVVMTGPATAARGHGVALLWPLSTRRWFLARPLLGLDTDLSMCRSLDCVLRGLWPEIYGLGTACAIAVTLATVL